METSQPAGPQELFDADAAWRKHAAHPVILGETIPVIPPGASLSPKSKLDPRQLGKVPGTLKPDGWIGFNGSYKDKPKTTTALSQQYGRWGAGIGMLGRLFPAIDIDVGEVSQGEVSPVHTIKQLAFDYLGLTVVRSRSGSPRVLLIYRSKRLRMRRVKWIDVNGVTHTVELLGYGQYYNIEGPHPKGGAYEWDHGEGLCEVGLENIPEIEAAAVDRFFAALVEWINATGGTITRHKGGGTGASSRKSLDDPSLYAPSPQHVLDILAVVPCNEETFETRDALVEWLPAAKSALGKSRDEHWPTVLDYLLQYPGAEPDYIERIWLSIDNASLGWSFLEAWARGHGYTGSAQEDFDAGDEDPCARIPETAREKMFKQFVWIKKLGEYHDTTDGSSLSSREFNAMNVGVADFGRSGVQSAESIFQNSPDARKVDTATSRPGEPLITQEENELGIPVTAINLWRASNVKPSKDVTDADVAPYLDLLGRLVGPEGTSEREHFLDYCAYVVQRPGEKIGHALVIIGAQGTGKDTLLKPLFAAVGFHNVASIDTNTLFGQWSYYLRYQIVYVQEIMTNGRRDLYNHIKPFVSGQATRLAINEKNRRQFFVPNNQNWIVTSNHDNAIALEDDDRRFWVHRVRIDEPPADEYFASLHAWFKAGGTEKVFGWLLQRDISGFNPMARPPMTAAKRTMLEQSQPAPVRYLRSLFGEGKPFDGRTIITSGEVSRHADQDWNAPQGINSKNIMAVLRAQGFRPAHKVRIGADTPVLWARDQHGGVAADQMRDVYLVEREGGQKGKEAA
jgi:hypothetical protein